MEEEEIVLVETVLYKERWRVSCHQMWQDIFGDSDEYMDYYECFKWPVNQVFLLRRKDKLCAMLHLNPYRICQGKEEHRLHYIVGVSTREEMRGKGYMGMLIKETFRYLYGRDEAWTYLMPAAQAIYEPYQFCPVSWIDPVEAYLCREDFQDQAAKVNLQEKYDADGKAVSMEGVCSYEGCSREEKKELVEFSHRCLSRRFRVYAVHDEEYFQEISQEMKACGGELLVVKSGGAIIGYTEYMYDEENQIPVEIAETVFAEGKRELGYGMIKEYLLKHFVREKLRVLFTESAFLPDGLLAGEGPGRRKHTRKCQLMARILVFPKAARSFKRPEGWPEHIYCQITDPFLEENNGVWELCFGEKDTAVRRTQEEPDTCMDIREFTALYFKQSPFYINDLV